jgi:peroxiredoxin
MVYSLGPNPEEGSMRLLSVFACAALVLGLVGCNDTQPDPAPKEEPSSLRKKLKHPGKLTFHEFKGQDSNQATGGKIKGDNVNLVNAEGKEVALSTLLGKPLVMVFMRGFNGDVCPYCTTYTAQMATRYEEFKKAGAEILVIYPTREDDNEQVGVFKDIVTEILEEEGESAIPFPVYLDLGTRVVKHYNLIGDLSKVATFVLDANGKIHYLYVGRDTDDRPSLDRVLEEVRRLGGQG